MKVKVPETLADIKLSQYLDYLKEIQLSEKQSNPEMYLQLKAMYIFCGLTEAEVMNIEYEIVVTIIERIKDILSQEPSRVEFFKIGTINFGWIPKLDDMTYSEFIDLNSNISNWETIIISMGVLYRPVIKKHKGKYLIEEYKGDTYHDALMSMPMDAVIGSMVFFWNLGLDCLKYMTKSLETEGNQMSFQNQLSLVDAGVGTQHSMNYLTEILQSMKR